jgi:signal transduction histidine kinase
MSPPARTKLIFALIVCYVFFQFLWWFFLMNQLNNEVFSLSSKKTENIEIKRKLDKRKRMFVAEGLVFLSVLGAGVMLLRKNIRKETQVIRQQKNFLLSVTHEFKSPLASLRLQTETLMKRDLEKEKMKQILHHSVSEIDRLTRLTDQILLATRLESSRFELHPEKLFFSAESSRLLHERFSTNTMEFKRILLEFPEQDIAFVGDPVCFSSILINLVENALKYSPAESPVTVSAKSEQGKLKLSVSDCGHGVSPANRKIIFEKFFRLGNEETRSSKGTGLGLYIVKNLVEMNKGTVMVDNNPEGGSVFHITLPLA